MGSVPALLLLACVAMAVAVSCNLVGVVGELQCAPAATSDVLPANPGIPGLTGQTFTSAGVASAWQYMVRLGCSERVNVYTQTQPYTGPGSSITGQAAAITPDTTMWPRQSCPHLQSGMIAFETIVSGYQSGAEVTIPAGAPILLRPCSLPATSQTDPNFVLRRLIIPSGATLVVDDQDLTLRVEEIKIDVGGAFLIGAPTCRLFSKINIFFHGSAKTSSQTTSPAVTSATASLPSKGLISRGILDVHGKLYHPTWTRLARTAGPDGPSPNANVPRLNDPSVLFLAEAVNWEVGQQIVVATSILLDCDSSYAWPYCAPCSNALDGGPQSSNPACKPVPHQNEIRTIVGLAQAPHRPNVRAGQFTALLLDSPLQYSHYAGPEYQSEVSLLTRRINFAGVETGDKFGGHVQIAGPQSRGRLAGVRGDRMGQLNNLGRYPFHFHMQGDNANSAASYIEDSAVTTTYFRCYTVHGTNRTRLSRNTAFNATGMCFYFEDGVEENNLVEYNLAMHVHPILRPAGPNTWAGGFGQGGETFLAQPGLLIPADTSAAGFYFLNAYNAIIGNAASGGWTGFAFPNTPGAMGDYKASSPATNAGGLWCPQCRPLLKFLGNTAHSAGAQWPEHGSCVYIGAKLDYDANGVMRYMSGRNERDTFLPVPAKTLQFMAFEDLKVWLCNKGIAHWGNTVKIINAEMHDVRVGAMGFGQTALTSVLINGRTPNLKSDWVINRNKIGFQCYDTGVRTILSGVTFRNYTRSSVYPDEAALRGMDHSDHYTPQGINAVRGIRFENVLPKAVFNQAYCSSKCAVPTSRSTMANRMYSFWDSDGSFSGRNVPTIMGSSFPWWDHSPELPCTFDTVKEIYTCEWRTGTSIGYIPLQPGGFTGACATSEDPNCNDQNTNYMIGYVSQWGGADGRAKSAEMAPWFGMFGSPAGITNTGWYWRTKSAKFGGIDGAPSSFKIGPNLQLERTNFVVLAIAYPPGVTFAVTLAYEWFSKTSNIPMSTYALVTQPTEPLKDQSQYTCSNPNWWEMCTNTGGVGPAWFYDGAFFYMRIVAPQWYYNNNDWQQHSFISDNVQVPATQSGWSYSVTATCSTCTVQSTLNGVQYWAATDMPPASRFPVQFGVLRTNPSPAPAESLAQQFMQCSAVPYSPPPGPTGSATSSTGVGPSHDPAGSSAFSTGADAPIQEGDDTTSIRFTGDCIQTQPMFCVSILAGVLVILSAATF